MCELRECLLELLLHFCDASEQETSMPSSPILIANQQGLHEHQ